MLQDKNIKVVNSFSMFAKPVRKSKVLTPETSTNWFDILISIQTQSTMAILQIHTLKKLKFVGY